LRSRGIRHLVFTGIATNVCVESTLRDGFFLEYFGVVLEDATHQAGPAFAQQAALFNIETFLAGSATSRASATRCPRHPAVFSQGETLCLNR
jgi:ureidoacrylate peracid hydrolase